MDTRFTVFCPSCEPKNPYPDNAGMVSRQEGINVNRATYLWR